MTKLLWEFVLRTFTLSEEEFNRLDLVQMIVNRRISVTKAAVKMGLSRQRMSYLVNAFRKNGPIALASGKRGKPANNKICDEIKLKACALIRERYSDFGPTLAAEYLDEIHDIHVSRETLRKWMIDDGIWTSRAARQRKVHQYRQRKDCRGELVQLDGSHHDWFEGRGDSKKCCLLVYIDDATSELLHLEFVPSESTFALMGATKNYLEKHGRPLALYTDKAGVYRNYARSAQPSANARSTRKSVNELDTQFTRALDELGVTLICANSPQAKGRVERANGVLQDRLLKAMRLEGISSMDEANNYAPTYIARHNKRFARPPRNSKDLHSPLADHHNIDLSMCAKSDRKVTKSLDLRYEGHTIILDPAPHEDGFDPRSLVHCRVDIHDYPDGRLDILYKGRHLKGRVFNKAQRIKQSDIADSKRLDAVLEYAKAFQDAGLAKTYNQRRRRSAQPNSPIKPMPKK